MLIVGSNLKDLINQYNLVDSLESFDNTSISLRLANTIIHFEPDSKDTVISYEEEIPDKYYREEEVTNGGSIILAPKSCILACSYEKVIMPNGYFGLVQTKGSLARLFVSLTCTDGQVDPGYQGKITFEICNLSNFHIKLKPKQKVGQLFLFKTSKKVLTPYNGRYQNATTPTRYKLD